IYVPHSYHSRVFSYFLFLFFFLLLYVVHRDLHSFPTRRSSDLREQAVPFSFKVVPDKNKSFDEESKKAMVKELAIVNGLIPDDDNTVDNLDEYFKNLGV